jgi:hypothetical protein
MCYLPHLWRIVGLLSATGIPLMALAMANIASMLITVGDPAEAERAISAKVTTRELRMMQKFNLDDGDGEISRAEYILLCTVRLGALSPELIGKINERFKELDTSGDGVLSYAEILEDPEAEGIVINALHASSDDLERAENGRAYGSLLEAPKRLIRKLSSFASQENGEALLDAVDNV